MECKICKNEYNLTNFISFRIYDGDVLTKKIDLCSNCINDLQKDESDKFMSNLIEDGYGLYEISRCSCYTDCEKIGNLRKKCEKVKKVGKSPGLFDFSINPINWCDPGDAGIIRASVRLYELFDNYDKSSTKLNENMLKYTKNMHHLTWFILGFTIISIILTILNLYIAFK